MGAFGAVIGAVSSVGGTIASLRAGKLQRQQQTLATRQSQRQAVREAQIRRAQTLAAGQALGVGASSGVAGGVYSLGSQLGGALGFSSQMSGLSSQISMNQSRSAFAGLGADLFQMSGGLNALRKPTQSPDLLEGL